MEFKNEQLALYAVHYLNNLEIVTNKGLIVDFSMEDQRALFKRKEKIERWRKIASENKEQKKKERSERKGTRGDEGAQPTTTAETTAASKVIEPAGSALDLGQYWSQKKAKGNDGEAVEADQEKAKASDRQGRDPATLKAQLNSEGERLSRGQRQRLKRKIARQATEGKPSEKIDPSNPNPQNQ